MAVVEFPQKRISEILGAEFDKLCAEGEARVQALEARERSLIATVTELTERVGDLMNDLALREEIDKLKAQCREFANA